MIYNRIQVAFGSLRKATAPAISYQYDVVQKLIIKGVELPEYYQVDFCNDGDTSTITMVGTADGVDIPDQFLQTGKTVKAYLVVTGVDDGAAETRYEITIPVNKRPARTDIEPTPEEQRTIDSLIAAMNDAVDDAEASATAAEGFADNASASADRAEQAAQSIDVKVERAEAAAQSAGVSATRAEDAAEDALAYKNDAAQSAGSASSSAEDARNSKETAIEKADEAEQSAAQAAASAESAEGDAQEAEQAAQQAEASATAAEQSATAAQGSATAASGSATVATNKAAEASASATTATNKATEAANSATAAVNAQTGAEAAQAASEAAQQAAEEAAQSISESAAQIAQNTSDIADLDDDVSELKNAINEMLEPVAFSYSGVETQHWGISSAGKWSTSSAQLSYTLKLDNIKRIRVTGNANGSIVAFLNTFNPVASKPVDFSTGYTSRIEIDYNVTQEYVIEGDMNYFYALLRNQSGDDKTPTVYFDYLETDETLTISHVPADAKATGERLNGLFYDNRESVNYQLLSDGELYEIPTTGSYGFARYKDNGGTIVEQDFGEYGTDYIECPPYVCITFGDPTARLMMYFYTLEDGEYVPRWDILSTTTSGGIKNYLNQTTSFNRVISVPSGTYMKVSTPVSGDVKVFGWSGKHFGNDICGYGISVPDGDTYSLVSAVSSGYSGLLIPGNVRLVVSKNMAITNIWGSDSEGNHTKISGYARQSFRLPDGYDYFIARIREAELPVDESGYTYTKNVMYSDLNDRISFLTDYHSERPSGRAAKIIERAKKIIGIQWTCMNTNLSVSNSDEKYKYQSVYEGTPYMSRWTKACYLGWHVSAHTFVNAANDVRSVFYKETGRHGGPGYGLVCSSFSTLVAGWPYPLTNNLFPLDPKCREIIVNKPQIGMIMTKNEDHCLIPETFGYGSDFCEYTLYEQAAPQARRAGNYTFTEDFSNTARKYSYLDDYVYAVNHEDAIDGFNGTYSLDDVTIVNGSARPYRGDRSVYTSNDTIKINIKNSNATICYYQKCTYNASTDVFTPTGAMLSEAVQTDDSLYAILDKSTLEDECFYAVWTDADETKEYFEYHVDPQVSYTVNDGTITFNNVPSGGFWYALWWSDDVPSGITEIIPYLPPTDKHNYIEYMEYCNPNGATGYMFFKGTLGAYVVPLPITA